MSAAILLSAILLAAPAVEAAPSKTFKRLASCYSLAISDNGIGINMPLQRMEKPGSWPWSLLPSGDRKGEYLVAGDGSAIYYFQFLSNPKQPLGNDAQLYAAIKAKYGTIPDPMCVRLTPLGVIAKYSPSSARLVPDSERTCAASQIYDLTTDPVMNTPEESQKETEIKVQLLERLYDLVSNSGVLKRLHARCVRWGVKQTPTGSIRVVQLDYPPKGKSCGEVPSSKKFRFEIPETKLANLPATAEMIKRSCRSVGAAPTVKARISKFYHLGCRLSYLLESAKMLPAGAKTPQICLTGSLARQRAWDGPRDTQPAVSTVPLTVSSTAQPASSQTAKPRPGLVFDSGAPIHQ